MPFGFPDVFEVEPPKNSFGSASSWTLPVNPELKKPDFKEDDETKKLFGIELAKGHSSVFEAALGVFPEDTAAALWVSSNWLHDPVVIASRDLYLKTVEETLSLLDKEQLAARVLKFANEVHPESKRYLVDAKERLDALKFYAQLQGFIAKDGTSNGISGGNFIHNEMKITLVKAENNEEKILNKSNENTVTIESDDFEPLPIGIKLIGKTA